MSELASSQDKLPLTERVHTQLRSEILQGRLQPGQFVLEAELAARFGVSKTPVREALRLLAQDDWVLVMPRKGYLIRPLGIEDLREVFHLREMLEPGFAAEAAWRWGRREVRDDNGISEALAQHRKALDNMDLALESASNFHIRIAEMSGQNRGVRIISNLVDEVTRLHNLMPGLDAHINSREELEAHAAIADAIRTGDQKGAEEAMRAHLRSTHDVLVETFGVPRRAARG